MSVDQTILITGGAGFIGSHCIRHFVRTYPNYRIINADVLTYAGNLENLVDVQDQPNYIFEKLDITDLSAIQALCNTYSINSIIHLAAESHVDRSILDPHAFLKTNILGTANLCSVALEIHQKGKFNLFYHVSTDEVYGSLGETGFFTEETAYDPRSPYSASKASSDHIVRAYYHTYGLPIVLSNCSNNYGPYQFPEKLIPLIIRNIQQQLPLPVYGDGLYTRDWLWVEDHVKAIDLIFHNKNIGETFNIGGSNEWKNIDLIHLICDEMDAILQRNPGTSRKLITFVKDRPGHDRRYAIDSSKLQKTLGWKPSTPMAKGIRATIHWYLDNQEWLEHVTSGAYKTYYDSQYSHR